MAKRNSLSGVLLTLKQELVCARDKQLAIACYAAIVGAFCTKFSLTSLKQSNFKRNDAWLMRQIRSLRTEAGEAKQEVVREQVGWMSSAAMILT